MCAIISVPACAETTVTEIAMQTSICVLGNAGCLGGDWCTADRANPGARHSIRGTSATMAHSGFLADKVEVARSTPGSRGTRLHTTRRTTRCSPSAVRLTPGSPRLGYRHRRRRQALPVCRAPRSSRALLTSSRDVEKARRLRRMATTSAGCWCWGSLYPTVYAFYDADYDQTKSHYRSGLNFGTTGDVGGPFQVGSQKPGFVSGYMAPCRRSGKHRWGRH